jgi:ABC-type glycerol-3-phosphate transport system substrate-binding protein
MTNPTRRSVVCGSLGIVAAGTFGAAYFANAQAKTATVWWVQGFVHEEDIAFRKLVSEYEKASGNTIDATVIPYAPGWQKPGWQKIVVAMTSGEVPDLFQNNPPEITALYAAASRANPASA